VKIDAGSSHFQLANEQCVCWCHPNWTALLTKRIAVSESGFPANQVIALGIKALEHHRQKSRLGG